MIALGCDHGGYDLMCKVIAQLESQGVEYKNFGIFENQTIDYPDIAYPVARAVAAGEAQQGILICGTGIGMSMTANKVHGVRAAVCTDHFSCRFTRMHNDANVLCLGGRVLGDAFALELVDIFLNTPFEGGRHTKRIEKMMQVEQAER